MNKYINKTFSKPDEWIACIDLGEDKVYGKIKDGKALLERIPSPNTGYRFNDIVEIGTPIGKTFIRDDEILVYQAIKVVTPSNLSTFSFEVIIPNSEAWGDLHEIAESFNAIIEVEYKIKYEGKKWTTGYCVTPNIKVLKSILEIFVISGNNRKVKNVKQEFENHDILIDEIKGEDFILELKYPIKVDGVLFAILLLPLLLLMLEVLKLGIKTISDVFGFLVMLLIMIVLDAYIVIKIKRFKIVVNREGILIYNSLSKNKFIRWDDIIKVNFDKKRGIITIKNSDGIKMRISHLLISFKRFCIIAKNLVKFETERSVFIEILYKAGIKWSKN